MGPGNNPDGEVIDWQIKFTEKPIGEEELRGVAVYCGVKLAQAPFFFLLSGGLAGQHGQQYLTGRVSRLSRPAGRGHHHHRTAEDKLGGSDRSRLLDWGQNASSNARPVAAPSGGNQDARDREASNFSRRIDRLKPSEAKIVKRALLRIAAIPAIDQPQFEDLAAAILTAWEGGRLRGHYRAGLPYRDYGRERAHQVF